MIELCDDCEFTILFADLIGTLSALEKADESFALCIWVSNRDLPFRFESDLHFEFLQEGLRIDDGKFITYLFYDIMEQIMVERL